MERRKKPLGISIILFLLIVSFATIAMTYRDTAVTIGDTIFYPNISNEGTLLNPEFVGFVESSTEIYIYNSGLFDFEKVVVDVEAFFISTLFGDLRTKVGEDTNELGVLPANQNLTKTITIQMNLNLARLAVEDGIIELKFDISFMLESIPYTIYFEKITQEEYSAPFSPLL